MNKPRSSNNKKPKESVKGITAISVRGYKSLFDECRLEIRPLTILAGANSSGKSSAMQPLLLLKQTLEASYDPGALLLNGPNVDKPQPKTKAHAKTQRRKEHAKRFSAWLGNCRNRA